MFDIRILILKLFPYHMGLSLSFQLALQHNHIDHICMAFLQCVFVNVLLILCVLKISFGSIRSRNVANRFYRGELFDVQVMYHFF